MILACVVHVCGNRRIRRGGRKGRKGGREDEKGEERKGGEALSGACLIGIARD